MLGVILVIMGLQGDNFKILPCWLIRVERWACVRFYMLFEPWAFFFKDRMLHWVLALFSAHFEWTQAFLCWCAISKLSPCSEPLLTTCLALIDAYVRIENLRTASLGQILKFFLDKAKENGNIDIINIRFALASIQQQRKEGRTEWINRQFNSESSVHLAFSCSLLLDLDKNVLINLSWKNSSRDVLTDFVTDLNFTLPKLSVCQSTLSLQIHFKTQLQFLFNSHCR